MAEIRSEITMNTKPLEKSLQRAKDNVNRTMKDIEKSGSGVEEMFNKIGKAAAMAGAAYGLQQLASQIINVRKEFKNLEVSFSTLLGSEAKGVQLFKDITDFATSTPMLEKDLASAAQTMLSFNIAEEKVMPLLKQMGDISMGDSQKLQSLSLAFSQASSTGKLMGQDLMQMINAGFNPLAEISRTTGKSMEELKNDMSAGKITIEQLEGAFASATGEGGKFNGMLEKMSQTMAGSLSNLEGAFQKLFNEMGTAIEDGVVAGVDAATSAVNFLAENIELVKRALEASIATFGVYKVACWVAASGVTKLTTAEKLHYAWLVIVEKAQKLLNATMLKNPYVFVATIVTALAGAMYTLSGAMDGARMAESRLVDAQKDAAKQAVEEETKVKKLEKTMRDNTLSIEERTKALNTLKSIIPSYLGQLTAEGKVINDNSEALKEYKRLYKQRINLQASEKVLVDLKSEKMQAQMDLAMLESSSNLLDNLPIGGTSLKNLKAASITMRMDNLDTAITAMEKYVDMQAGAIKETKGSTKVVDETFQKGLADNKAKLKQAQKQLDDLKNSSKSTTKEVKAAMDTVESLKKGLKENYGYDADAEARSAAKITSQENKKAKALAAAATKANKAQAAQQQKFNDLMLKAEEEYARKSVQITLATEEARIAAMEEGTAKTRAAIKLDYAKRLAEIQNSEDEMLRVQTELARKRWEIQNPNAGSKGQNWENTGYWEWLNKTGGAKLSQEQTMLLEQQRKTAKVTYDRQLEEMHEADQSYMRQYLQQYGDYQQKKLAIAEEYAQKIASASTAAEKAALMAEQEAKEKEANDNAILKDLQFEKVFSNLSEYSRDYLASLKKQLEDALGKLKDPDQQEKARQKISEINSLLDKQGGIFSFITEQAKEQNRLLNEAADAQKRLNEAKGNEFLADKAVDEALSNALREFDWRGLATDFLTGSEAQDILKNNPEFEGDEGLTSVIAELLDAERKLAEARQETTDATTDAAVAESKAKKSRKWSEKDSDEKWQQVIGNVKALSDLQSSLGLGGNKELTKGIEGLGSASNAVAAYMSGDYISALSNGINAVNSFGEAMGAWSNSNREEVEARDKELVASNSALADALDSLRNSIEDSDTIAGKYANYDMAKRVLDSQQETARQRMLNNASMYDGGRSLQYDFNKTYEGSALMSQISKLTGKNVNTLQDIISLSAESLNMLYKSDEGVQTLTQLVQAIVSTQDDSNYNGLADDILQYIKDFNNEAYEDLQNTLREAVTGVSYDSFKSNFKSMLADLSNDTKAFSKNFTEQLSQSIINARIDEVFSKEVQDLYSAWNDAFADGGVTQREIDELQQWQEELASRMIAERDVIAAMTGLNDVSSSEASATVNAARSMSEDTANELIGRITAVQLGVERIASQDVTTANQIALAVSQIGGLATATAETNSALADIRELQRTGNEYLADIAKYNKSIYEEWGDKITTITEKMRTL